MKHLALCLLLALLCCCERKPTEIPAPTAPSAVTTADNRIGQGLISYESRRRGRPGAGVTTIMFVSNSFTSASFRLRYREIRPDSTVVQLGTVRTPRLRYEDTVRLEIPLYVPVTSEVRVKQYYIEQAGYGGTAVFMGDFPVEREL